MKEKKKKKTKTREKKNRKKNQENLKPNQIVILTPFTKIKKEET